MKRKGQGEQLPIPTIEELSDAGAQGREVVACSGLRYGPLIALTIALHNGDIATICLNDVGRATLLSALKALIPNGESIAAARAIETEYGAATQVGRMSE